MSTQPATELTNAHTILKVVHTKCCMMNLPGKAFCGAAIKSKVTATDNDLIPCPLCQLVDNVPKAFCPLDGELCDNKILEIR